MRALSAAGRQIPERGIQSATGHRQNGQAGNRPGPRGRRAPQLRSAAERIPSGMRAVTITALYFSREAHSVTRTFTSPAAVGRLAALLNGAHAAPGGMASCPLIQVTYRLAFASPARAAPYLVAVDDGCLSLRVTALGRAQPARQEPAGLRAMLARQLYARASPVAP